MKLNKLAFSTLQSRNTLAALALASSLCALAPQAYADGIDFDTGGHEVHITSSSITTPTILKTVTATCPQNGYLYAMAGAGFTLNVTSSKRVILSYSLAKDGSGMDLPTNYSLNVVVPVLPGDSTGVTKLAGNPVMRVDECAAGESVTYRFLATKSLALASDPITAVRPKLIVTFHQTRI